MMRLKVIEGMINYEEEPEMIYCMGDRATILSVMRVEMITYLVVQEMISFLEVRVKTISIAVWV